jgi:hypothetical protein
MSLWRIRFRCRSRSRGTIGALIATTLGVTGAFAQTFPDNTGWRALLDRHVTAEHLVDYRAVRERSRAELDRYVDQLAKPWPAMQANGRKAALINAYNALTIRWIVENYPVESIWRTKKPFNNARHTVDGKRVSLDDIETELRKGDARIHGALVCAARSCPPLRREPYRAEDVDRQLDDNMRQWLAMPDRNRFDVAKGTATVSKIFDWYGRDFDSMGGVRAFLEKYAPAAAAPMFASGKRVKIAYQKYRWGLNDTSELGTRYSDWNFYRDRVLNEW